MGGRLRDWNTKGLRAAQPAATAVDEGYLYYVSDEDVLERSNGTTWDAISSVTAHAAAADPHAGYQKESEKSAADGYAALDSSTKVPIAELPTGTTASHVAAGDHDHSIGDMDDVDITTHAPDEGDIVVWRTDEFVPEAPTATPDLDDLADVDATGGSEGDVLTQQADGSFALEEPSAVGGLDDLSDVDTAGQSDDDILVLDATYAVGDVVSNSGVTAGGTATSPSNALVDDANNSDCRTGRYLTYDFGSGNSYMMSRVTIKQGTLASGYYSITTARIQVSDNNVDWTTVHEQSGLNHGTNVVTFTNKNHSGRYWRVYAVDSDHRRLPRDDH